MANENIVNCNLYSSALHHFTQFTFDEMKMKKKKKFCFCDENDDNIYECGQKVQISMLSDLMCNTVVPARFSMHE